MTKTEYQNTIKTNLTAAEGLCAELRKLRNFKRLAGTMPAIEGLLNADALDKAVTDREAKLKEIRAELNKARRIVKHLEEIEAIESGKVPAPAKKGAKEKPDKAAGKVAGKADPAPKPKAGKAAPKTTKAVATAAA